MIKQTIKYTNYNGVEKTKDLWFNLTVAELMEMELTTPGGFKNMLEQIIAENDNVKLVEQFKKLILASYGEKSADGERFVKSKEISEAFTQTPAFTELYVKLLSDANFAADFVNGLLPKTTTIPQVKGTLPNGSVAAIEQVK